MKKTLLVLILCVLVCPLCISAEFISRRELKAAFDGKYTAFTNYVYKYKVTVPDKNLTEYKELVNLGPCIVPLLIARLNSNASLPSVITDLARRDFTKDESPIKNLNHSQLIQKWWSEDRNREEEILDGLFEKYKELDKNGDKEGAQKIFGQILEMGVIALPRAMEMVRQDYTAFIRMAHELTKPEIKPDTAKEECLKWWNENRFRWTVPYNDIEDVRGAFDAAYKAYRKQILSPLNHSDSKAGLYEYEVMKSLGPHIVPYLMTSIEKDPSLLPMVQELTLKKFSKEETEKAGQDTRKLYLNWWKNQRNKDEENLDALIEKWKELYKNGDGKGAEKILSQILDMGMIVLPRAMEMFRRNPPFLEVVNSLIKSEITFGAESKDTMWWFENSERWTIPLNYKDDIKSAFDIAYKAYIRLIDSEVMYLYSNQSASFSREYKALKAAGPCAVPYFMEKLEEEPRLVPVIVELTGKHFKMEEIEKVKWDQKGLYLKWWNEHRNRDEGALDTLFEKWKELDKNGEEAEAKKVFVEILHKGIIALPRSAEMVKQDHLFFIKMVHNLTRREVRLYATKEECLKWWEENKERWTIPLNTKNPWKLPNNLAEQKYE